MLYYAEQGLVNRTRCFRAIQNFPLHFLQAVTFHFVEKVLYLLGNHWSRHNLHVYLLSFWFGTWSFHVVLAFSFGRCPTSVVITNVTCNLQLMKDKIKNFVAPFNPFQYRISNISSARSFLILSPPSCTFLNTACYQDSQSQYFYFMGQNKSIRLCELEYVHPVK